MTPWDSVLPSLGAAVILIAHDALAAVHIGDRKLLHWLRQRYWWHGMAADCATHTKTCKLCQRMKFTCSPGYGFMQLRLYDGPGKSLSIDIVVLHHATAKGTKNLFTILDNFSHYADAHPLQQAPASECAKALLRWVYIYGVPQEVRSDRGLNLNLSEVFKELYKLLGVTSILGQPYAPQSNSVERFHRWLGAALRILFYDSDLDVDDSLGATLMIWRSTVCRVTGFTPAMLHFGREMRFLTDAFSSTTVAVSPEEYVHHVQQQMQAVWQAARTAQQIAQDESAHYYNLKHGVVRDIAQGSHVFKWKLPRYQGEVSTHLLPRCTGPYKVLQISGRGAKLQHCVSGKTTTASLRHIKPAYLRAGDDQLMDGSSALYTEGKIVIVRLAAARNAVRKWQVCRLDHTTMDERGRMDSAVVQFA